MTQVAWLIHTVFSVSLVSTRAAGAVFAFGNGRRTIDDAEEEEAAAEAGEEYVGIEMNCFMLGLGEEVQQALVPTQIEGLVVAAAVEQ